jgi:hypothetical protein
MCKQDLKWPVDLVVAEAPMEVLSFRLGCGGGNINLAQRSNWYHEFLVPIASLGRVYISSSAPQSERKAPKWGAFLRSDLHRDTNAHTHKLSRRPTYMNAQAHTLSLLLTHKIQDHLCV